MMCLFYEARRAPQKFRTGHWHCITIYLAPGARFTNDNRSQDSHSSVTQMHVHQHTPGPRYLTSDNHNV